LVEGIQRIPKHNLQIQLSWWLIQSPECFHIIGVQFKQLADEPLGNLIRIQVHAVQSAEQSQQIQPRGLQPRTQIHRNIRRFVASHTIEHRAHTVPGQYCGEEVIRPSKPW
jgi:hypothetical protein